MEQVKIQCCLCGGLTHYNQSKMCINCLQLRVNLTSEIQKDVPLQICRYCEKYNRPPWLPARLESAELLNICLHKIKGIAKVKIVDSGFIWTEPHSKRIQIKIKVQKEVEGIIMEQECVVKFIVQDTQCDDCKKTFTPHTWVGKVQIRQKVEHMRTLFHLEQMIIKNNVNKDFMAVKQKINGFDVHFSNKTNAKKFVDFVHSHTPAQIKESKQLISSDYKSNTYNYKYTYVAEIAPICKDDLLILPPNTNCKVPGLGSILLCTKVTTQIHVIDMLSFQTAEIKSSQYWKSPFSPYESQSRLSEFIVLDIEKIEGNNYEIEVARSDDERFGETTFRVKSHIGKGINCGDTVLGYDLVSIVTHHWDDKVIKETPDIILVKKLHQKKVKIERLKGLEDQEVLESEGESEEAENFEEKPKIPNSSENEIQDERDSEKTEEIPMTSE